VRIYWDLLRFGSAQPKVISVFFCIPTTHGAKTYLFPREFTEARPNPCATEIYTGKLVHGPRGPWGFAQKVILDPLLRLCRPDVRRGFATPLVLSY